jgi:hypothetical protein
MNCTHCGNPIDESGDGIGETPVKASSSWFCGMVCLHRAGDEATERAMESEPAIGLEEALRMRGGG